tara:strand:- start:1755 stop:2036 length:282 start_codon:yes stop_codon:yes gene_type:complete
MLDGVLKSDLFFFISSVSIVAVTVAALIVLLYVAEILRDIRHISKNVKKESDHFTESIHLIIKDLQKGSKKATSAFLGILPKKKNKGAKKKNN